MSIWVRGLNDEQKKAAMHNEKPLLILAGAGSGKTTVLVSRTGRLIEELKVPANRICILTFTNKAAREMKARVKERIGKKAEEVWAGTFHSFGLQILKKHYKAIGLPKSFAVFDQTDSMGFVKEILTTIKNYDKDFFDAKKILSMMNNCRKKGQSKVSTGDDAYDEIVEMVLPKYILKMKNMGGVDFDALLLEPLRLFKENPKILEKIQEHFLYCMVDEFQDTNDTQMELIEKITGKHNNLVVVGDDDQSIYGWRGAEIENILNFPKIYKVKDNSKCEVVRLEKNYRSTPQILEVANTIISKNTKRHAKVLRPHVSVPLGEEEKNRPEVFCFESEEEEVERTILEIDRLIREERYKYSDMAILYRSNGQGALFEAYLKKHKVPYQITGNTGFFDRKETKDVLGYIRCLVRPNELSLRRIFNAPSKGIGDTSLKKIEELALKKDISFFKALCRWRDAGVQNHVGVKIDDSLRFLQVLKWKIFGDLKSNLKNAALDETENQEQSSSDSVRKIILDGLSEIGYRDYLARTSKDAKVFGKRWEFIDILLNVLETFISKGGRSEKTFREFVDAMELRDSDAGEDSDNCMRLMTIHASKGLEFPIVFLVGAEEDLLPHKTLGSDVNEERRLFYVAVTRAKQILIISHVQNRLRNGSRRAVVPSRFLLEVPQKLLRTYQRGMRPVSSSERKVKLADLFSQLDESISDQKIIVKK